MKHQFSPGGASARREYGKSFGVNLCGFSRVLSHKIFTRQVVAFQHVNG